MFNESFVLPLFLLTLRWDTATGLCNMFSVQITASKAFGGSGDCVTARTRPKHPVTPTTSHILSVLEYTAPWKSRPKPLVMHLNRKCVLHFDHRQCSHAPRVVTGASSVNRLFPVANKQQEETMRAERVDR